MVRALRLEQLGVRALLDDVARAALGRDFGTGPAKALFCLLWAFSAPIFDQPRHKSAFVSAKQSPVDPQRASPRDQPVGTTV